MPKRPSLSQQLGGAIEATKQKETIEHLKAEIESLKGSAKGEFLRVPIDSIEPSPYQQRKYFDPIELQKLADNIKQVGILQKIVVRRIEDRSQIIFGERRWRAAKIAALEEIEVIVVTVDDREARKIAHAENAFREDINPVEETWGILDLLGDLLDKSESEVKSLLYQMENSTHNVMGSEESDQIVKFFQELGKMDWKSFVKNRLPLLKLPDELLSALQQGKLEYTKVIALKTVKDSELRRQILREAIEESLSLIEIKRRIKLLKGNREEKTNRSPKQRVSEIFKKIDKSQLWESDNWQEAEVLLARLEQLLKSSNIKI